MPATARPEGMSIANATAPHPRQVAMQARHDEREHGLQRNLSESTKRHSPSRKNGERLKLAPSPNPNTSPTHRSAVEARNQDRLLQLIRNGGSTPEAQVQIANIHGTEQATALVTNVPNLQADRSRLPAPVPRKALPKQIPPPLRLDANQASKAESPDQSSPRKKLFHRLGLGTPVLKPSTADTFGEDPTKSGVPAPKNTPPKAAQVLGTQSLSKRLPETRGPPVNLEEDAFDLDISPTSHNNVLRDLAPNERSTSRTGHSSAGSTDLQSQASLSRDILQYPEPRLPNLNASISSGNLTEPFPSLKFYDGDIPPTPPSKTKVGPSACQSASTNNSLKLYHDETPPTPPSKTKVVHTISQSSKASKSTVYEAKRPPGNSKTGRESPARTGVIQKSPAHLVEHQVDARSVYGALEIVEDASTGSGGQEKASSGVGGSRGRRFRVPPFTQSMYFDTTRVDECDGGADYLHPHYGDSSHVFNEATAWSGDGGGRKTSNTSNITSASVPIFFDGGHGETQPNPGRASEPLEADDSSLASAISNVIETKLAAFAEQIGTTLEHHSRNTHARFGGIDRGLVSLEGRIRKLGVHETDTRKRLGSIETWITIVDERLEWLQDHVAKNEQGVLHTSRAERSLESIIREQGALLMALKDDCAALRLDLDRQQPTYATDGGAMGGRGGEAAARGAQALALGMYGSETGRTAAGQYFSSLGQQMGEPDIRQHPYYHARSHQ